ncbi:DUF6023 family protein [Catellatospora sp. KI3]|uniref:DUF6023 family protein n=1 Tax=Catellatospora sp. KI3 TaxID=3041620 RepID=UPI002482943C|nr:DUF6023 family protein [Catellatospora sp. KI3]MDI1465123.1 DUF6023 family protein [Catellatospora sp. KI3]
MDPRRVPTAAYVLLTAALLAAGGLWWHRAAPGPLPPRRADVPVPAEPPMTPQMRDALQTLPALLDQGQETAEVVAVLDPVVVAAQREPEQRSADLPAGAYELRLTCVAPGGTLRLALLGQSSADLPDQTLPCATDVGWQQRSLIVPAGFGLATVTTMLEDADSAVVAWRIIAHTPKVPREAWADRLRSLLPDGSGRRTADFALTAGRSRQQRFDLPAGRYSLRTVCAGDTAVRVTVTGEVAQSMDMFCDADGLYLLDLVGGKTGGDVVFEALGGSGSAYVRAVVGEPIPTY